ncbi:hypothetical protein SacglDRAFT_03222 [Saccharomonospora glauca K62]|uniref:Uncharacterized protein n=1 Tax=Saccharomonospora glauca K62 TaxID=928724 RepID=I1D563_9PSEU|nr:hypothetical protein SacglDRAFT_03222 [Saccharomonospora glauca K62]
MNNPAGISVEIPKRRLTVFTGVSGSGEGSLVNSSIPVDVGAVSVVLGPGAGYDGVGWSFEGPLPTSFVSSSPVNIARSTSARDGVVPGACVDMPRHDPVATSQAQQFDWGVVAVPWSGPKVAESPVTV